MPNTQSDSQQPQDTLFLWRTAQAIQAGEQTQARAMTHHALRSGQDRARIARTLIAAA